MIKVDLGREELGKPSTKKKKGFTGEFVVPPKYTGGKQVKVDILTVGLVVLGVIVALIPQPLLKTYKAGIEAEHREKMQELQAQVSNVDREISNLQPYKSELENYNKQKQLVSQRLGVVQSLLAKRGTPVNVLDTIGQSLPRRAWLKVVQFKLATNNPSLMLAGEAYSNEEISDYLDKLSESVFLGAVRLETVGRAVKPNSVTVKQFEITASPILDVFDQNRQVSQTK